MSNNYFDNTNPVVAGSTARSSQINSTDDAIEAGFDGVQADMYQAFRTSGRTPAETDMQISADAADSANKLVGFDATGAKVQLYPVTPNIRGAWATATAYVLGDIVNEGPEQSIYYCLVSHTSGVFATDLAAGKWKELIDNTGAYQAKYNPQIITANYPAVAGDDLLVDVSGGPVTITLPAAPNLTDNPIGVTHIGGDPSVNPITIAHNGNKIMGTLDDMQVTTANASLMLGWSNATYGWRLIRGT